MLVKALNSGLLPGSKEDYEDLEGFLGSIHLTYVHFKDSKVEKERVKYHEMMLILKRLAHRHGLQVPEEAVENARTEHSKWLPQKMAYERVSKAGLTMYQTFRLDPYLGSNEDDFMELEAILKSHVMEF